MPAALQAQAPVGELFAGDASVRGSVVLAASGTSVLGGSQVSAGQSAAVLKLQRGGELRICPRTSLSVNTSPTGDELMIGFNTGSLELHYTLAGGSDTVMTPDFRIQMIGPGTFHLALAADSEAVPAYVRWRAPAPVLSSAEILGGGSYQVAPDAAVTFAQGKIAGAKKGSFSGCGCPAPAGSTSPAPAVSHASSAAGSPPPGAEAAAGNAPPNGNSHGLRGRIGAACAERFAAFNRSGHQAAPETSQAARQRKRKPRSQPEASTAEPAKSPARAGRREAWILHRIGRFFAKTFGNG